MALNENFVRSEKFSKRRRSPDFLEIQNDILTIGDVLIGITVGYAASLICDLGVSQALQRQFIGSPLWRDAIFGSVIAALVLREPRLVEGRHYRRPTVVFNAILHRGGAALAILVLVAIAAGAFDRIGLAWALNWVVGFGLWVILSRWVVSSAAKRRFEKYGQGDVVSVFGAPGLAERLAAMLLREARVAAAFGDFDGRDDIISDGCLIDAYDLARDGLLDNIIVIMAPDPDPLTCPGPPCEVLAAYTALRPVIQYPKHVPGQPNVKPNAGNVPRA